jgi:hypothetical protein
MGGQFAYSERSIARALLQESPITSLWPYERAREVGMGDRRAIANRGARVEQLSSEAGHAC